MEESTFAIEGVLKRWGFEVILGFYEKTLLKCFIPIIFYPTSKGKERLGKILIWWKLGVLLFSNELP